MRKIRSNGLHTRRALVAMERALGAIRELGSATKNDIAEHLEMSETWAGMQLRRLDAAGRVACLAPAQLTRQGWLAAVWAVSGEDDQAEAPERTVVLARAGNVGMHRDPLIAALFGAA